jgi:hypothetical protein
VLVLLASGARLLLRLKEPPAPAASAPEGEVTDTVPAEPQPPPAIVIAAEDPPAPAPDEAPAPESPPPEPGSAATQPPAALPPAEITISVMGAPPGMVAIVGGRPRPLPLRLRRASTPIEVVFRAPGFSPRRALIDRDSNQTLQVVLREAPAEARGKRPRPGPARPAEMRLQSPSGAPIIDP